MPYVIYNPVKKAYRSNSSGEKWERDINASAVFRTEANAVYRIRDGVCKWERYVEQWAGHPNLSIAVEALGMWSDAAVVHITFRRVSKPK